MKKECGDCHACCVYSYVKEISKPPNVKCKYRDNNGCTIYNKRPQECREYSCLWLAEINVPQHLRPDKCNVIFDQAIGCSYYYGYEIIKDAHKNEEIQTLIGKILQAGYPVVFQTKEEGIKVFIDENRDGNIVYKEFINNQKKLRLHIIESENL